MNIIFSSCVTFIFLLSASEQTYFLSKNYINTINNNARTWKAGINFHPETPLKFILRLLGSKGVKDSLTGPFKSHDPLYKTNISIPIEFDARKQWKNCTTIRTIRDQGNCGSCWAFSTTGAFADRLCINSSGRFNELLSAEHVTSCCYQCGLGCQGGYPIKAWKYYYKHGLVTGGNFNSFKGCQPYKFSPCSENDSCSGQTEKKHKCQKKCYGNTTINYRNDHRYIKEKPYNLEYNSIQHDIMTYGPIEASFEVYDDFLSYKSGVYSVSPNATYLGGHSVKCIGWGVEKNVSYWLMMNSWNSTWGDEGYFKIRRGTNECKVDNSTSAGIPEYYA
ncbi:cathepsin B-like [Melanaphis sacchari]|uniref:Cathepsin B-like cysteine proteinase 5 n=1 Tax=Melanaphis sacchari TaxID=742174 RepID=A0A2H8TND4_9HEMI|nr:cathepsin B-like [Melanaphis sacchari]XP_025206250.1 cathepsin B-like [Melanaphis sacchari]